MENVVVSVESVRAASKVTLGDLLVFVNWMQQVSRAYENGDPLPAVPELASDAVKAWAEVVGKIQDRSRQSDDKQMALEASLEAQEHEVGRLVTHLHENIASLYENLGQQQKAQEVRQRAAAVHSL